MGAAMLVEMLAMGLGAEMMVAVLLGVRMEVDRVVMMEAVRAAETMVAAAMVVAAMVEEASEWAQRVAMAKGMLAVAG